MNEFELIARYFSRPVPPQAAGSWVAQAGGDDCALLRVGDRQLAITTDLLLEGRHFLADVDPGALGHKALAVNLSDLAAAGATPRCFLLALALPRTDEAWLAAFSAGLYALAEAHDCALVGGDTTRVPRGDVRAELRAEPRAELRAQLPAELRDGPLTVCITALGEVPVGAALGRAGALPGHDLWVSGTLGDAALALRHLTGQLALPEAPAAAVRARLERPTPRIELGTALRGLASACMDVSDGLVGDAGHIAARSGVQVVIESAAVPMSAALLAQPIRLRRSCALTGGDDYELLFTAAPSQRAAVQAAGEAAGTPVARIGTVSAGSGVQVIDESGRALDQVDIGPGGYDHFATP